MVIEEKVLLKDYSTLHVGGYADFFCRAGTKDEVREAVMWAQTHDVPYTVIGEGSNILFADLGYRGLIIKNEIKGIEVKTTSEGTTLLVGAGEVFDDVVHLTCERAIWGLENFSAIPGTIGATPIQNVGAYGVEISSFLLSVEVYDSEDDVFTALTQAECKLSYRHSIFKEKEGRRYSIVSVSLFLSASLSPQTSYRDVAEYLKGIQEELTPTLLRTGIIAIRSKKFPDWHSVGTLGSFFKNPTLDSETYTRLKAQYPGLPGYPLLHGRFKISLGWVLDHVCGVRGVREGDVGTYTTQALVLVNYGEATAHDVISFAEKIAASVQEKININIEWEVTRIQE